MVQRFKKSLVAIAIATALAGCQMANYKLGDISRVYCGSTNTEIRADIKASLSEKGISIGVDYCSSVGLVDALLSQPE
jgi:hypothetical protein